MATTLNPIVVARISEMCHNILRKACILITQFNSITGTGHDEDLINCLLDDYFAEANKGQWTPELLSIMKDCVDRGDYPEALKLYVSQDLMPTLPSALSK